MKSFVFAFIAISHTPSIPVYAIQPRSYNQHQPSDISIVSYQDKSNSNSESNDNQNTDLSDSGDPHPLGKQYPCDEESHSSVNSSNNNGTSDNDENSTHSNDRRNTVLSIINNYVNPHCSCCSMICWTAFTTLSFVTSYFMLKS